MFSALPARADIALCSRHVCFVPHPDFRASHKGLSTFEDLVVEKLHVQLQGLRVRPSGSFVCSLPHASASCFWVKFLALLRRAWLRLASLRSTPVRLAPFRVVPVRLASFRLAPVSMA